MSDVLDCPSCGGPFPEGRRCCPHCHCKYSGGKKVTLAIAAAIGIGAAACGDDASDGAQPAYGVFIGDMDLSATPPDLSPPRDMSTKD